MRPCIWLLGNPKHIAFQVPHLKVVRALPILLNPSDIDAPRTEDLILTHLGRKSGTVYRTPANVFRVPEGFLIALTYGRESEWVKNVLAAGGCELETRGVRYQLFAPTIVHDPARRWFR